jgi:hypothetical protein
MEKYYKILFKLIFFNLIAAIATAFLIFYLYNLQAHKRLSDAKGILNEEGLIRKSFGFSREKFRFCSYPEFGRYLGSTDLIRGNHKEVLRLRFNKAAEEYYLGIHLVLTLQCRGLGEQGSLLFRARLENGETQDRTLTVFLTLAPGQPKNFGTSSVRLKVKNGWQKVILPLRLFSAYNPKDPDASIEISEILFALGPLEDKTPAGVLITDLKIINGDEVIYEPL